MEQKAADTPNDDTPNTADVVTTTVRSCARCGEDHADLEFLRMSNPFDDGYPFWAPCPKGKGPVLLASYVRTGDDS